jgi:hypothetical protein
MELQARFHVVGVRACGRLGDVEGRHQRDAGQADAWGDDTGSVQRRSRHTTSETGMTTSMRTPWVRPGSGGHELSKPRVIVISCNLERIGPRVITAPQRGHVHVAGVGASVGVDDVARCVRGARSSVRARARRAVRQVFARNPDCRIRTKPRGRMCWTKRRRNSIADSVIVRDCPPCA